MYPPRPSGALRRAAVAVALACSALMPTVARSEVTSPVLAIDEAVESADITVQVLRGNVSVLMGSGGNIGVLTTAGGKLMIDGGIAVSRPKIIAALDPLGPGPVRFLVDTHYHWDHTDGNAWLHEAGATIVAHEKTAERLKDGTRVIDWAFTFRPVPPGALPTDVFKSDKTITFGDETIALRHRGTGHTDTDITAHFEKADILFVGDIWWNGYYPFIDYSGGGGIDGLIRQVDWCIRDAKASTLIVPGHGPVGSRAELVAFRDMLVAVRANVARLKHRGKTLAETVAAQPTAAFDAKYGQFLISPAFFTHLVYLGV